jgi:hypothetical protein
MSLRHLKASLCLEAKRVRKIAPSAVWYLFGSVLRAFEAAADFDLLIVCDSDETVARVRYHLREVCARLPLHLMLVTQSEEAEIGFIVGEGCVQLYPFDSRAPAKRLRENL